jgi:hypothetical protein
MHLDGLYLVLLRIEAADDKEADSNLELAGAGTGIVHAGAVAGFPIPPLRYYVGSGESMGVARTELQLLGPAADVALSVTEPVVFSWTTVPAALLYRLEVRNAEDEEVLSALLQSVTISYRAPSWLVERVGVEPFRWRVVALGVEEETVAATAWRQARFGAEPAGAELELAPTPEPAPDDSDGESVPDPPSR